MGLISNLVGSNSPLWPWYLPYLHEITMALMLTNYWLRADNFLEAQKWLQRTIFVKYEMSGILTSDFKKHI